MEEKAQSAFTNIKMRMVAASFRLENERESPLLTIVLASQRSHTFEIYKKKTMKITQILALHRQLCSLEFQRINHIASISSLRSNPRFQFPDHLSASHVDRIEIRDCRL
jgi:hypothetical protein